MNRWFTKWQRLTLWNNWVFRLRFSGGRILGHKFWRLEWELWHSTLKTEANPHEYDYYSHSKFTITRRVY